MQLISGNVECGSCHNPHVQNIDSSRNSSSSTIRTEMPNALCLACHNTTPTGTGMGLAAAQAKMRVAAQAVGSPAPSTSSTDKTQETRWHTGATAFTPSRPTVSPARLRWAATRRLLREWAGCPLASYTTLRKNGCLSCHTTHNATPASLLRGPNDQACINCHSGGSNVSPPAPNIYAEMASPKINHSITTANGNNTHSAHESDLLNHNRHATCVDCHNPHGTKQVGLSFPAPPVIRASQEWSCGNQRD